jgi:hypothetical protein
MSATGHPPTRYPLAWPASWKRTPSRVASSFGVRKTAPGASWARKEGLTIAEGLSRLIDELGRLRASHIVISTDVRTRGDGLPYSTAPMPKDPGVAVYFKLRGADRVLACDRYTRLPDNMAAIAAHIEGMRATERHGVGTIEQAFAGYTALPAAPQVEWWLVLQVPRSAPLESIDAAYRELAKRAHPDLHGGNENEMMRLNVARDAARAEKAR